MLQALAEKEAVIVRQQAALVRQEAALVSQEAALVRQEAALVRLDAALGRQEEDGLNNAVRLMVQSPLLEALKEDSRGMRQVTLHSMNSTTLMMQYKLSLSPQTALTPLSHS